MRALLLTFILRARCMHSVRSVKWPVRLCRMYVGLLSVSCWLSTYTDEEEKKTCFCFLIDRGSPIITRCRHAILQRACHCLVFSYLRKKTTYRGTCRPTGISPSQIPRHTVFLSLDPSGSLFWFGSVWGDSRVGLGIR